MADTRRVYSGEHVDVSYDARLRTPPHS